MDKFYPGINEIIIAFSTRHKTVRLYLNAQQKLNTMQDTEKTEQEWNNAMKLLLVNEKGDDSKANKT